MKVKNRAYLEFFQTIHEELRFLSRKTRSLIEYHPSFNVAKYEDFFTLDVQEQLFTLIFNERLFSFLWKKIDKIKSKQLKKQQIEEEEIFKDDYPKQISFYTAPNGVKSRPAKSKTKREFKMNSYQDLNIQSGGSSMKRYHTQAFSPVSKNHQNSLNSELGNKFDLLKLDKFNRSKEYVGTFNMKNLVHQAFIFRKAKLFQEIERLRKITKLKKKKKKRKNDKESRKGSPVKHKGKKKIKYLNEILTEFGNLEYQSTEESNNIVQTESSKKAKAMGIYSLIKNQKFSLKLSKKEGRCLILSFFKLKYDEEQLTLQQNSPKNK